MADGQDTRLCGVRSGARSNIRRLKRAKVLEPDSDQGPLIDLGPGLVIPDKRRSRTDPGSIIGCRSSAMDPGSSFARPG